MFLQKPKDILLIIFCFFFCFLGLRIPNKLYPGSNPSGERKLTTSNPDDPHLKIIEYNKKIERDSK